MQTHKHKGVERSNGTLRAHPIDRKHMNSNVICYHNKILNVKQNKYKQQNSFISKKENKKQIKKVVINNSNKTILLSIDVEGYISLDLDKTNTKGLRVSFTRKEGRSNNSSYEHRKTIRIEINNNPDLRIGTWKNKKTIFDKQY